MSAGRVGGSSIGVVFLLIGLPVVLAAAEAVTYHVANRASGSFVSSGERREYVLYVPSSYDRSKEVPLVISLHGAAMWGAAQRETSRWNRVAEREGFIVVYPSAVNTDGPAVWRADRDGPGLAKDVRFIGELIDTLKTSYRIDSARIFANGLSNGGGMSFVLSCRMSDRIAAVGVVAGAQLLPFSWCAGPRAVPMIAFHGTADKQVPYKGGKTWAAPVWFPNVQTWTANWARRNSCSASAIDTAVARDVTRRSYASCAHDASVVLYTIDGGGHTWPGGAPLPEWFAGRTATSIDADSVMWEFYRAHPLVR